MEMALFRSYLASTVKIGISANLEKNKRLQKYPLATKSLSFPLKGQIKVSRTNTLSSEMIKRL